MTPQEREWLAGLLARALAIADPDSEERWGIVQRLHARTDRPTFEVACMLAGSGELAERVLGLDVLGQFGYPRGRPFREETLPVLVAACEDRRAVVTAAAITALGHLGDPDGRGAVLERAGDAADEVRFAAAVALPMLAGEPADAEVVGALIRLSADPDRDVRDWATMGLGSQLDVDTPAVREALVARLADGDADAAGEALVGLARRKDPRALPALLAALATTGEVSPLLLESATALGAAEALPALTRLDTSVPGDGYLRLLLDQAVHACGG